MNCSRGVAGDPVGGIHQAERGRRDDRLLHRHRRVPLGDLEEAVRVALVAERAGGQARHAAGVAGRERDHEAVGRGVRQPVHGVGPEVVILPLLAVGDHRGAGRLEPRDGVANGRLVQGSQAGIVAVLRGEGLDQLGRSRDAADGLGGDGHRCVSQYGTTWEGPGGRRLTQRRGRLYDRSARRGLQVGDPLGGRGSLTEAGRDLRLDFFRGLALFCIFVDHLPDNMVSQFTLQSVMFGDAAEVFILISGLHRGHGVRARHGAAGLPDRGGPRRPPACGSSTSRTSSCSWSSWR